jgi:hypothetical protein
MRPGDRRPGCFVEVAASGSSVWPGAGPRSRQAVKEIFEMNILAFGSGKPR